MIRLLAADEIELAPGLVDAIVAFVAAGDRPATLPDRIRGEPRTLDAGFC